LAILRGSAEAARKHFASTKEEVFMSGKPTIILVHGFWGGAAHWAKVIPILARQGYRVRAVENPLTSLADDASRTQKMIAQQNGPVLLVGHSYGGAVITEAGTAPGVVGLVYIAGFAPDAGESLLDIAAAFPAPPGIANAAPDSDGYVWINPEKFGESFCQDLTTDEQLVMALTQKAPMGGTFADKVTVPAWKSKPSWYQVSSEDRMIAPDNENRLAERMKAIKTVTLKASHASLASMPNEVAALIVEAATATAGKEG
jgi:pimeloyl-ACP methyl ester carboxylesterase